MPPALEGLAGTVKDLAKRVSFRFLSWLAEDRVELAAIDYSRPMLDIATSKAAALTRGDIAFSHGDVARLPFPDGHFDCAGISFAFRNLTYKNPLVKNYLAEVLRVLKAGGRFVIVETSQPESKLIRKLLHLYLRGYAFGMGYLISGNKGAYHYLAESTARFYSPAELSELLLTTGFSQVTYQPMLLGAVGTHVATK